jgi:hypothetical protein
VIGRTAAASLLVLFASLAVLAPIAQAEEPLAAGDDAVELRIDTVLASNTGTTFDSALASLRQPFVGLFPYSSYRLLQGEQRRLDWRCEAEFLLPGGRSLVIVPRGFKDDRVLLNVMLIAGARPLVNTALALKNHGVFLMAGPHYEEGVLIIAIAASTAPQAGATQQAAMRTP